MNDNREAELRAEVERLRATVTRVGEADRRAIHMYSDAMVKWKARAESAEAALAAGPAEATASRPPETSGAGSIAPVAAEEGGEQEAGGVACEHREVRRLVPDEIWACVTCGIEFDPPPFEEESAPSGSDEQGNRPATPDANGVHDTKGGE